MRNGWIIASGGLFLLLTVHQVATYGRDWQVGKYGMPSSILAADGCHYGDGEEVDPITLALVRSGYLELAELLLTGVVVGSVGLIIRSCHNHWRTCERHCQLKALLDTATECQRAGQWKEAEEAFRRFETLWAADKRNPPLRRIPQ